MRDKARQVLLTISWGVLLAALVVGLPLWGLWVIARTLSVTTLRWCFVALPGGLAVAFLAGFYCGKVQVTGFLGGFDRALEGLARAVDLRDNARLRMAAARPSARPTVPPAQFNVYLPDPASLPGGVPITHRQVTSDVVDL